MYHIGTRSSKETAESRSKMLSYKQRWSPRGHILKSLASRPQVLENWPVLGSRTALIFELLKFCGVLEKFFGKRIFVEIAWKIFVKTFFLFFFWDRLKNFCEDLFFFRRALALVSLILGLGLEHSCPWPREVLSSERLSLASDFFCVLGLGLEPCVLYSTSDKHTVLLVICIQKFLRYAKLRDIFSILCGRSWRFWEF